MSIDARPAPGGAAEEPAPDGVDMDRVGEFAGKVLGIMAAGATTAAIVVGDRLGLYAALAGAGPCSSSELAGATGTAERYVREWLAQQAAMGIVECEPVGGTFSLPAEHAAVLAEDGSPVSMASIALLVTGMHRRTDELVAAFRTGDGIPWGEQDPVTFESTERFFGGQYRGNLVGQWIPALDGMHERLAEGALVADVGCGRGLPLILLAQAYPRSRFVGYDVHGPSIETASRKAADAGVADRVRFEVDHCHGYPAEGYDLITFFDSFHDLGDPVGAAEYARSALAADGTVMLVELLSADTLVDNVAAPGTGLNFAASTFLCTTNSLSQPVGLALGAMAGEKRLREVLGEAGYGQVRRVSETPMNMVLEARP
ncbi:class I SAM-dependent methyltransferase [Tomitella gaofuii]|uniref:class I SAM-dependent methyltransferase n=1 Tax=Tomitella gaofuii TaxID=2760083 RepID=UPI001F2C49CE|nr:class I SAM-dependent methyltransferase [Tomitella gaofuii]